jgi:hypothetical protein
VSSSHSASTSNWASHRTISKRTASAVSSCSNRRIDHSQHRYGAFSLRLQGVKSPDLINLASNSSLNILAYPGDALFLLPSIPSGTKLAFFSCRRPCWTGSAGACNSNGGLWHGIRMLLSPSNYRCWDSNTGGRVEGKCGDEDFCGWISRCCVELECCMGNAQGTGFQLRAV